MYVAYVYMLRCACVLCVLYFMCNYFLEPTLSISFEILLHDLLTAAANKSLLV